MTRTKEQRKIIDACIKSEYPDNGSIYVAGMLGETANYIQRRAYQLGVNVTSERKRIACGESLESRKLVKKPLSINVSGWGYA